MLWNNTHLWPNITKTEHLDQSAPNVGVTAKLKSQSRTEDHFLFVDISDTSIRKLAKCGTV